MAALESLNTASATAFNTRHPQGKPSQWCGGGGATTADNVRYYSAGSTSAYTNLLPRPGRPFAGCRLHPERTNGTLFVALGRGAARREQRRIAALMEAGELR